MPRSSLCRRRILVPFCLIALVSCGPQPGPVQDEAQKAGRDAASFLKPAPDEDYFRAMDGGITLTPAEIKGRNTWMVWTGGNDRFWNELSKISFGTLDLLKTISSHPNLNFSRDNRWYYLGLVNEPCFDKATKGDPDRWGLWLDRRRKDCPQDPFEDDKEYLGVAIGSRGNKVRDKTGLEKTIPVGSFYGYATGIVGLRLFPNPAFDEKAAKDWDAVRYYEDPSYYRRKDLVTPFRVGMSCAFCHVGPNPVKPPKDPEHPKWENLSSNVGAQYFWVDRIFAWEADKTSFPYQLFHTSRPGTLDTSLISSDYINNPRTMNAVYQLGARLKQANRWGQEKLDGGGVNNKQFNDYVPEGHPLTMFFKRPDTVWTPRVLKDGSDSVGALGALNRVFLNIGLFSEEWLLHFNPLVGGKRITPIEIAVAEKNSIYWQATEAQTPDMALFFLKSTVPHRLKDAPGGEAYLLNEKLPADRDTLTRGKVVFAGHCARCHSSKIPPSAEHFFQEGRCVGSGYLKCWEDYWKWTKKDEFKGEMKKIVLAEDFRENNYLSTDLRVPITLLETNACSPLATNAIAGNIWDNFSSQSYKDLPSVGEITVHDPIEDKEDKENKPRPHKMPMPAGGRGYTRVPSLVSLWSTAPFLLNNSVGKFNPDPSVEGRMESFRDSIEQLLWPDKRDKDPVLGDKVPGVIDRTTTRSYLRIPKGYLPDFLQVVHELAEDLLPAYFTENGVEIGPIPAGTPVNLLANLNLLPDDAGLFKRFFHKREIVKLLIKIKRALKALPDNASDEEARKVFRDKGVVESLFELSKCPDFVVNRGHYFGTDRFNEEPRLSDEERKALIWFLKTL